MALGERLWIPHEDLIWAPAILQGSNATHLQFAVSVPCEKGKDTQETVNVDKALQPTLKRVLDEQCQGVDNIVDLEEVTNAAVLATVRQRFLRTQTHIYTRVSRILIAVNPFKKLNIYTAETMKLYLESPDSMLHPPHLFGVAADAAKGLIVEHRNQAVLISGESGAGKTESTKLVLSYASEALGKGSEGEATPEVSIAEKVMQTNPILEAFGNAMTMRNNNSSRFGKWLQMAVSGSAVKGSSVTDYLLELTRVTRQGEGERNYHIFFQLMESKKDFPDIQMEKPGKYRYLKDAQFKAPGVDDKECYAELKQAMEALGFTDTDQANIFKCTVGLLTLGNAEFDSDGGEGSALMDNAPVQRAATLLGLEFEELKESLTVKSLQLGKDFTKSPRSPAAAEAARDGLARLIYGRLFKFLVARINVMLADEQSTKDTKFFGVLDIAGFESFERNSLEQLSINLSNEHLQQHFNNHIFKMELSDYEAEGVELSGGLTFEDNGDIINLIDAKGSILALLDEEVAIPKATDATFVAKLTKNHEKHPRYIKPKFASDVYFGVRHFAGTVQYDAVGFLEKNVDAPPAEAPTLFSHSSNDVLKILGETIAGEVAEAAGRGGGRGKKGKSTVSGTFRASLSELVKKLNEAEPHFIRCIKPNAAKVPAKFTSKLVMEQLTSSGVFEAVRIRQCGFASRVLFKEFLGRYRIVVPKLIQARIFGKAASKDLKENVTTFLKALPEALRLVGAEFADTDVVLGKAKIFAKAKLIQNLDNLRDISVSDYAIDIQRVWRGHNDRKMIKESTHVFADVKTWLDANNFYDNKQTASSKWKSEQGIEAQMQALDDLLIKVSRIPLNCKHKKPAESVKIRMTQEVDMIRFLPTMETSLEPHAIDKALTRAKDIGLQALPCYESLRLRVGKLKVQVPIVKAIKEAVDGQDPQEMAAVMNLIKKHKLDKSPENWIPEMGGQELASTLYNAIEQDKAVQKAAEVKAKMDEDLAKSMQAQKNEKVETMAVEVDAGREAHQKAEEEKQAKRAARKKKRVTLAGASEEDVRRILTGLARACEAFDASGIEEQLQKGLEFGLDQEQDLVKDAEALFEKLSQKEFVMKMMWEYEEAMKKSHMKDKMALKALQNLVNQARRLGIEEMQIEEARIIMQKGVRARARTTIKGQVFEEINMEEVMLADGAFSNLFDFPGLKKPDEWEGHAAKHWYAFGFGAKRGKEIMLIFDKHDLRGSLTKVGAAKEKDAINCFMNLVNWMGDSPSPETQRAALANTISEMAAQDKGMADEVYVQLMKQLTSNPGSRSVARGWDLMLMLCQQACPGPELHEFLHVFLMQAVVHSVEELQPTIRQCIGDLNVTASPERLKEENTIFVDVNLIDFSMRKVRIPASSTLRQLGDILAEQLRISAPRDFACFMLTDGFSQHRLIPDNAIVADLQAKWAKLKERTDKSTRMLFKRRLLLKDEVLKVNDSQHATLTYRQALYEFLNYPITENNKLMIRIAAAVLWTDRDFWHKTLSNKKLGRPEHLEQLLPEAYLRDVDRAKAEKKVLEDFDCLAGNDKKEGSADKQERRLKSMSRAMSDMQKLKLFGAYYWHGKQQPDTPKSSYAIEDAPSKMYIINPKEPTGEYFVCVDWSGIHFVAQGTGGTPFARHFHFNEENVERVLLWGAHQDLFQIIISSVDPDMPMKGRYPMSICVRTPAAVDIMYAIHIIHVIKSGQQF